MLLLWFLAKFAYFELGAREISLESILPLLGLHLLLLRDESSSTFLPYTFALFFFLSRAPALVPPSLYPSLSLSLSQHVRTYLHDGGASA